MTNGSVSFSVAQAIALETEGLKVTAPAGDFVTLSDTAANIEKLTATQIAGLAAIGVAAIAATNASVSLSAAQTSAVNTAGLSVSAPANDAVTEHNADGSYDIVYSGITGQAYSSYQSDYNSAGVLTNCEGGERHERSRRYYRLRQQSEDLNLRGHRKPHEWFGYIRLHTPCAGNILGRRHQETTFHIQIRLRLGYDLRPGRCRSERGFSEPSRPLHELCQLAEPYGCVRLQYDNYGRRRG